MAIEFSTQQVTNCAYVNQNGSTSREAHSTYLLNEQTEWSEVRINLYQARVKN